jgi:hypothetical protein
VIVQCPRELVIHNCGAAWRGIEQAHAVGVCAQPVSMQFAGSAFGAFPSCGWPNHALHGEPGQAMFSDFCGV